MDKQQRKSLVRVSRSK